MENKTSFEHHGDVLVAKLAGRIHGPYAEEFDQELTAAAQQAVNIVLDMEQLEFISSSGLRTFLKLRRIATSKNGKVVFARPYNAVMEVFRIASFQHLFPIYDELKDALDAF